MIHSLVVVGGSVLTLFLIMSVGFILAKKQLLGEKTLSQLSTLLLSVVAPALIIDCFQVERTADAVRELLIAAAALAGTYALYIILARFLFRRTPEQARGVLRFAVIYGNTGFMGVPLIQATLGSEAMLATVVSLVVFNVLIWTQGISLIGGKDHRVGLKKVLLNPAVIGFVIALVLYATGFALPGPVASAVHYVGNLNTPLAMIVIGGQLAGADFRKVIRDRRLYAASALKLIGVPVLTALVLLPFSISPLTYSAIVILSACPTAGTTGLFSQMLGRDTELAAGQVTLSTLLCIVTLPIMAALAQALA